MSRAASFLLLTALAGGLASGGRARAGDLEIDPVSVALSAGERSATIALRNAGSTESRYEIKVAAWSQSLAGKMQLAPTAEIVAFPAMIVLKGGEKRNLRVGLMTAPGPLEKSYRLFIEELPPAATPDAPSQVQVLTRIGIPVFVAPHRTEQKALVSDLRVEAGHAAFSLRNAGTVHVRPSRIRLRAVDAAGSVLHEEALEAWYLLAGGEREYDVAVPAASCASVRNLVVLVELPHRPIESVLATPQGACGP